MAKEVSVKITKVSQNQCEPDPRHFKAERGDFVTFEFNEPGAEIVFRDESPFDASNGRFKPSRKQIRSSAPSKNNYRYDITWPGGGVGDGTGEVIP